MIALVTECVRKALAEFLSVHNHDPVDIAFTVEYTKNSEHGDVATNVAMLMAKKYQQSPRDIAQALVPIFQKETIFTRVEVAGPGFINFFIDDQAYYPIVVRYAANAKVQFPQVGAGKRVLLEFVSANPTGPLHVGHGRGAAYGSALASLYRVLGYSVTTEYYLNDAGRQMHILALSVWLRYMDIVGVSLPFPDKGYMGSYVQDIAQALYDQKRLQYQPDVQMSGFSAAAIDEDAEAVLERYLQAFQTQVPAEVRAVVGDFAVSQIQAGIVQDLAAFGVDYDNWFSEKSLYYDNVIDNTLRVLKDRSAVYEQDGAVWFAATRWGDDKDRVFRRSNGEFTYFAADLAYHWHKFQGGYDRVIDIFGADHHGYVPRLRAGLAALGCDVARFDVILVQFAVLFRGAEKISMSTRAGAFVTLDALNEEVGSDAGRFFYLLNKPQGHMDFDMELAKKRSSDNPVFYVQYAHARICSLHRKFVDAGRVFDDILAEKHINMLTSSHERALMKKLFMYEEVVVHSASQNAPHMLVHYLQDLAGMFHRYYAAVSFIVDDEALAQARFLLLRAVQRVLHSGLNVLSVSAPEAM